MCRPLRHSFHCLCLHSRYMFILISSSTSLLTHLWSGLIVTTHSFKGFQFCCRQQQQPFKIVSLCFSCGYLAALQLDSLLCISEGSCCCLFEQAELYTANNEMLPSIKFQKMFKHFTLLTTRGHGQTRVVLSVAAREQK